MRAAAPPFSGVVIGEILECTRHPQADKLSVCNVTTDGKNRLQIVCGASNARAGLRSAVALVGARLPGDVTDQGRDDFATWNRTACCAARVSSASAMTPKAFSSLPMPRRLGRDCARSTEPRRSDSADQCHPESRRRDERARDCARGGGAQRQAPENADATRQ